MNFYDSDEDIAQEIDTGDDNFMKLKVQERTNPVIEDLSNFLKDPAFIMPKGNPSTNLINLQTGISYDIPGNKINKFFDYLERIRRSRSIGLKWEERQYYTDCEYSGIMIDLDIYQADATDQFDLRAYNLLIHHITSTIKQYIKLEEHHSQYLSSIHIVILRRPKISRKSEDEPFKDGLHILLPGIKIKKEVKKFFFKKLCNPDADIFKVLKIVKSANGQPVEEGAELGGHHCVDLGSATVPVFLFGCERRDNHMPYRLDKFYEVQLSVVNNGLVNTTVIDLLKNFYYFDDEAIKSQQTSLWIQEFSLHWEVASGSRTKPIISKFNYDIRPEYEAEVKKFVIRPEQDFDNNSIYGELDMRRLTDSETDFYQSLIDTLNPIRAETYDTWFEVLCVLAHAKGDRKSLAIYFSQKCPKKYNPSEFERFWAIAKNNKKNSLNIGSLCHWAIVDNPERYKEVCNRNVHTELLKRIFNSASEGILGHYDVASLLHNCLRYKYIYAPDLGGVWYECVTELDDHKTGELYKWRSINGQPTTMRNYISVVMPEIFMRALKTITISYNKTTEKSEVNYFMNVIRNFKVSFRKLKDSSFKTSVSREAQDLYSDYNFTDKLNKEPSILPVANGILVLGKRVKLISGYHNYIVSKYSPTNYMPFDPRNIMIKKVLYIYRNLFPDDRPDTHEFFMSLYASSLDARPKDQMFCMKVGGGKNGKTMTTEIHRNMLGHIFAITLSMQFITGSQKRDAEASSPATMAAEYARHVDYQESEKCETLASAKMKLITGGGTIGGRENYGEYRNFKLNCNHVADTNYEFKINDNSHGVWRRLKYLLLAMRFHSEHEMADFNPKDPHHRIAADVDVLKEDPEFLSAYLAVLVWYYERLQTKYNGSVQNVPHPHIQRDTDEYQKRQNKLSLFYTIFLVKCNDEERTNRLLIDEIRERYERWFRTIGVVDNIFKDSINSDIHNSVISGMIQQNHDGPCNYIIGYRLREFNDADDLKEGEIRFTGSSKKIYNEKILIKPETWDEYYEKICKEYDESQKAYVAEIRNNSTSDRKETVSMFSDRTILNSVNIPTLTKTDVSGFSTTDDILSSKELKELIDLNSGAQFRSEKIPSKVAKKTQESEAEDESEAESESETSDDD